MAIKISGVTIIDDSRNIVSGAAATFTSNVTIGGTLTYEDVTNIAVSYTHLTLPTKRIV